VSEPDEYGAVPVDDGRVALSPEGYRRLLDDAGAAPVEWLLPRELQAAGPKADAERRRASLARLYDGTID